MGPLSRMLGKKYFDSAAWCKQVGLETTHVLELYSNLRGLKDAKELTCH